MDCVVQLIQKFGTKEELLMANPIIQVKDLHVEFISEGQVIPAVDGVNFQVSEGETLGLVGESGCGKSTTALAIMRILPRYIAQITKGDILFNGTSLLPLSEPEMQKIRGNTISMIFQDPMTSLNPVYSIGKQLREGLQLHINCSHAEADKQILKILNLVHIPRAENILKNYPHELSGGMQQRIMIAMSLLCNPQLLIADEPTTALDVTVQEQILDLLQIIQEKKRMGVILITHDLGVVAQMCQRVCVMYAGQIVETGDIDSILDHPLHPYTQWLIAAIPENNEGKRLRCIQGNVPLPGTITAGCRFADRCPVCMDICHTNTVPVLSVQNRQVRCLRYIREEEAI
jgi:peptide/nickel transport system ATP-binding protein